MVTMSSACGSGIVSRAIELGPLRRLQLEKGHFLSARPRDEAVELRRRIGTKEISPVELLEAFLFDWSGDLYGQTIEVDKSHITTGSIMYDAVFVVSGRASADIPRAGAGEAHALDDSAPGVREAFRLRHRDERVGFAQHFIRPVEGRVSGRFGNQRVYNGSPGSAHSGMDIAAPGGTPVKAPAAGVVTEAGEVVRARAVVVQVFGDVDGELGAGAAGALQEGADEVREAHLLRIVIVEGDGVGALELGRGGVEHALHQVHQRLVHAGQRVQHLRLGGCEALRRGFGCGERAADQVGGIGIGGDQARWRHAGRKPHEARQCVRSLAR